MIYPDSFPEHRGDENGEIKLYSALKRLSKKFDIFYNRSFSGRNSGGPPDFEIDFIVTEFRNNRFTGLICIEAKGGILHYNADGTWIQNQRSIKSPSEQAISSMHALVARFPEVSKNVPFGWMLCFPDALCPENDDLPPNFDKQQIIDRNSLNWLDKKLTAYFDHISEQYPHKKGLTILQYQLFKAQLMLNCDFTLPLATRISDDEKKIISLTEEQSNLLDSIRENANILIKGIAGSGKTIIGKRIAREFAEQGLNVLFLCFNSTLAGNIGSGFKQVMNIKVATYHSFASEMINEHDPDWWSRKFSPDPDFFKLFVPDKLMDIQDETGIVPRFDVVIIDEGQDFHEYWFETVEYFLKPDGKFFVFMDELQDIFDAYKKIPSKRNFVNCRLMENCRNTKNIAAELQGIIHKEIKSKNDMPEGEPVVFMEYLNDTEQQTLIVREIKRLLHEKQNKLEQIEPKQILILLNTDINNSCLSNTNTIDKLPLRKLNDRGELHNNAISYTRINTFKGLEADIVFIIDTDKVQYDEKMLYTQASRAKHLLYIFKRRL